MSGDEIFNYVLFRSLISFAVIGSMVTWSFLSSFREHLYDPLIDAAIPNSTFDEWKIKIGNEHINFGLILKSGIKWILIMIVLFLIYEYIKPNFTPSF